MVKFTLVGKIGVKITFVLFLKFNVLNFSDNEYKYFFIIIFNFLLNLFLLFLKDFQMHFRHFQEPYQAFFSNLHYF